LKRKNSNVSHSFKPVGVEVNGLKVYGFEAVSTICNIKGRHTVIAAPTLAKLRKNWESIATTPFNPRIVNYVILIQDPRKAHRPKVTQARMAKKKRKAWNKT
jgi:hypothetical protein